MARVGLKAPDGTLINLDFGTYYVWICGHCGKIPSPGNLARMISAVKLLEETPKGYAIAEAGVHSGVSGIILSSVAHHEYHGFDSFEGLKPTLEDDLSQARLGKFKINADLVKAKFASTELNLCQIHVGEIPAVFVDQPRREYRFAHIDVDCYAPTLASLRYFWPQIVPGGTMVCDDYTWKGARLACDEFDITYEVTSENQAFWRKPGHH